MISFSGVPIYTARIFEDYKMTNATFLSSRFFKGLLPVETHATEKDGHDTGSQPEVEQAHIVDLKTWCQKRGSTSKIIRAKKEELKIKDQPMHDKEKNVLKYRSQLKILLGG
jgi:hypothetical protein